MAFPNGILARFNDLPVSQLHHLSWAPKLRQLTPRDDFSAPFAIMYGVLVFLKCFHWITADRVDYVSECPFL